MSITATKKKKDGLTCYRVRVPIKLPDGKFKYKEKSVYGLAQAKAAEHEMKKERVDTVLTLNQLVDIWNRSRKGQVREVTIDKATAHLKNHVLPKFGEDKLDTLTIQRLLEWKNEINEKDLTVTTKNNILQSFASVLNFGVRLEYLEKNNLKPLGNFKDAVASPEDSRFRYYTAEQFRKYISVIPRGSFNQCKYYVFFMIAFLTGARKGEINALKWSDLDGDVLHIRRSIAQKLKGKYIETPPKTKSSFRDIRIPSQLKECLAEHRKLSETFQGFSEDWRICGGPEVIPDTTLAKVNEKFARKAGLPRITIHEFRHSHASLLINAGINIKEISRRLGHSNVEMTWNVYSHLYPDEEANAIAVLEKV